MIALFGGTFDPVHLGHLHAAHRVADRLGVKPVRLVLSARPSHRDVPGASLEDRWRMLELAVQGDRALVADDMELARTGPSYTVETLEVLRAREGDTVPIVWVLGWDAYRLLPSWHRFRDVLELAHLVVVRRPGQDRALDETMTELTQACAVQAVGELDRWPAGCVLRITESMLPISSTLVRTRIAAGEAADDLLPPAVWTYIKSHNLYGGPTA